MLFFARFEFDLIVEQTNGDCSRQDCREHASSNGITSTASKI